MLKRLKKHTLYEIWNQWTAESVYVDHKPSDEEVEFVVEKEWGAVKRYAKEGISLKDYIRDYVHVNKEQHVYTSTAQAKRKQYRAERGEE